jgi:predicted GNAT superfamily acetyltransferase
MATSEAKGKADTTTNAIVIRKCHELDELRSCVSLQKEVWNFSDAELIPLRMFVVAEKIGGQVIGAFEDDQMIGFALAIPGTRDGHPYLHSQMVGVREGYRNSGLGRRIKWFQRDDALSRGFELMEWTFDPLEIKNAYLNIEKLGAIARRYHVNQYGLTTSPLQGGLPSDRLVAEWWLNSRRVSGSRKSCSANRGATTIEVPASICNWKASSAMRSR